MTVVKPPGRYRTLALGLLAAGVMAVAGTAAPASATATATDSAATSDSVQASTLGAQAAQSGRYFGAAVAAGKLGDGTYS
ncbi:1,4-beta-xylanase, partial [Streptomyces milbemycinicus]